MDSGGKWDEEERSVIGDEGEIGFIDFTGDKSVCNYNPVEEGPIVISNPFPLIAGKPQSVSALERAADSVTIHNTTCEPVDLWAVRIYASKPEDSFTLSLMKPPTADSDVEYVRGFLESSTMEDRVLQPGKTLTIWLSCKPKEIGLHTAVVHFIVEDETIERVVFLLADDKISQSLASDKPYSRNRRKKHFAVDDFVPGKRPERRTNRVFKYRLPQYPIPKELREAVEREQLPDAIMEGLTERNYASFFKTLLIMEEIQLEEDMRNYDMEFVTMRIAGHRLVSLDVPGLAERRPSLVCGDFVFAKLASEESYDNGYPYQGYIHRVESDEVFLKFADEFHLNHRRGDLYNVQFTYNRLNMRRLYQAVEAARHLETNLLFPSKSLVKRQINATPMVPISIALNEEQICSIEMILGCRGAPPYVIHGPPGTGKTMTLVEAILQLYKTRKNACILVCAPSNSAADHILEKILTEKGFKVHEDELFRLNATSRSYDDVNPDHIRFCCYEDMGFKCPPIRALMRYKIIISTYMSASLLYGEGIERGHFSHIILDEAGQASEPETMIPISHLCRKETVVVLAGDPMQLGPVVFSKAAETYGLGRSYLERLFDCDLYCDGNENYVTKLVRNYRCHPQILSLPSKLFYRGELIACNVDTDPSMPWVDLLPDTNFPVLFIGIKGCDEREGSNPSWFNRIEASKVVEIVKKLTSTGSLREEGIGVITPYRQQVLKIKRALEILDMPDIKVGSVEQFQGQERQVIIVSTVRSTIKHNEFDRIHCLGFLTNPRRFNVAVTRARSLLIIVGNPHIVSEDMYWNKLLWHCSDNNSYKGCDLPERKGYVCEDLTGNQYVDNNLTEDAWNYKEEHHRHYENDDWGPDSFQLISEPAINCGEQPDPCQAYQESFQEEFSKPVKDEAEWSDGWQAQEPSDDFHKPVRDEAELSNGWQAQEPFQDFSKPVTDESEWSDGWRD